LSLDGRIAVEKLDFDVLNVLDGSVTVKSIVAPKVSDDEDNNNDSDDLTKEFEKTMGNSDK